MPDLWKPFRRSHQPSNSSEDTLVEELWSTHISVPATPSGRAQRKVNGRVDPSKAAHGVAELAVTPQLSRTHSDRPWPGGFTSPPQPQPISDKGRPPNIRRAGQVSSAPVISMPTPHIYPAPGFLPTPPAIPVTMPTPASENALLSLTMQHALSGDSDLRHNSNHASPLPVIALPPPTILPRPHSDPTVPKASSNHSTVISAPPSGPSTPKRRKPVSQPPQSVPAKLTKANLSVLDTGVATHKRGRASSAPPTPASASAAGSSSSGALQCSGVTQRGVRCNNKVLKNRSELGRLDPELGVDVERYCHLHRSDVLEQPMTYANSKKLTFADYIPPYLQEGTVASLRTTMTQGPSNADTNGYIYTFEIIDINDKDHVQLKVGRAVNLNLRIDQWDKQCKSKQQVLRGWWPGPPNGKTSLLKGTVDPGLPGPLNHKLERLVHLELADLALNAPYLQSGWPKLTKAPPLNGKPIARKPCDACGTVHQEIFTFQLLKGRDAGREYDLLVKPVIAKWGKYLKEYWGS